MTHTDFDPQKVSISIGNVSGAGHVVVSGGDAMLSVESHQVTQKGAIKIAGVRAKRQQARDLSAKLDRLGAAVEQADLPQDARGVAIKRLQQLREMLFRAEAPDVQRLYRLLRYFARLGPAVAKEVISLVKDALFQQVLFCAGVRVATFMASVMGRSNP